MPGAGSRKIQKDLSRPHAVEAVEHGLDPQGLHEVQVHPCYEEELDFFTAGYGELPPVE